MLKLWEEGPQAYVQHLTSQNNFWLKSPLLGPDITSYIPTLALPCSLLPSRHLFISRQAISQCQWTSLYDNVIWFHSSSQKKKTIKFPHPGVQTVKSNFDLTSKSNHSFFFLLWVSRLLSVPLSLLILLGQSLNLIASQTLPRPLNKSFDR